MVANQFFIIAVPLFIITGYLVFKFYKKNNLFGLFNKPSKSFIDQIIIALILVISVFAIYILLALGAHSLGFE